MDALFNSNLYTSYRRYPPGYFTQELQMDFFNFAGIHRPVKLYTTPTTYLLDVVVFTDFEKTTGNLEFHASVAALDQDGKAKQKSRSALLKGSKITDDIFMHYNLIDRNGTKVAGR